MSAYGTNPKCRCAPPRSGDWGKADLIGQPLAVSHENLGNTPRLKAFCRTAISASFIFRNSLGRNSRGNAASCRTLLRWAIFSILRAVPAQTFNAGISDAGSSAALTWAENGPEPGVVLTCDAGGYSRWPDGHVARSPFSQRVRPAGGG
jgi:hypothetical protein